jgi:capsular exopolysaccharide synthesis family protein
MGRIAEALKRAQQERAQRLGDQGGCAVETPPPQQQNRLTGQAPHASHDVLSQSPLLEAPPPPATLPAVCASILPRNIAPDVAVFHQPYSQIAEKYRSARTRLLNGNPAYQPQILAVGSSKAGEGKTVSTANLGFCFAELRNLQTAVIDFDFRNRGLTRLFNVEEQPGLADVLRGEKKVSQVCLSAIRPNLHLIPAGTVGESSPTELLGNGRASGFVRQLKELFHYTLVDTPAINAVADMGLIGPLCNGVIMVLRMNSTPEPELQQSVYSLKSNNIPIVGGLLVGDLDKMAVFDNTAM